MFKSVKAAIRAIRSQHLPGFEIVDMNTFEIVRRGVKVESTKSKKKIVQCIFFRRITNGIQSLCNDLGLRLEDTILKIGRECGKMTVGTERGFCISY